MMVIPARLLGEEKFSLAYGFMLAGEGVGVYLGPPLVGEIILFFQRYSKGFVKFAGFFLVVGKSDVISQNVNMGKMHLN